MIKKAVGIPGSKLNTLMSSSAQFNFEKLLVHGQNKCQSMGQQYLKDISESGPNAETIN